GRAFASPAPMQEAAAASAVPDWTLESDLPVEALGFRVQNYGMTAHRDLFTSRQQIALTTFVDLIPVLRARIEADASTASVDAAAYARGIATYLGLAIGRAADYWSSLSSWAGEFIRNTFSRGALGMVWDFAEVNPFSESTGNWLGGVEWIARAL